MSKLPLIPRTLYLTMALWSVFLKPRHFVLLHLIRTQDVFCSAGFQLKGNVRRQFNVNVMVRHDQCLPNWRAVLKSSEAPCISWDFFFILLPLVPAVFSASGQLTFPNAPCLSAFICAPSPDLLSQNPERSQVGRAKALIPSSQP